jgi:hypothetical protein
MKEKPFLVRGLRNAEHDYDLAEMCGSALPQQHNISGAVLFCFYSIGRLRLGAHLCSCKPTLKLCRAGRNSAVRSLSTVCAFVDGLRIAQPIEPPNRTLVVPTDELRDGHHQLELRDCQGRKLIGTDDRATVLRFETQSIDRSSVRRMVALPVQLGEC